MAVLGTILVSIGVRVISVRIVCANSPTRRNLVGYTQQHAEVAAPWLSR